MKNDNFIDDLFKQNLAEAKVPPDTSWEQFSNNAGNNLSNNGLNASSITHKGFYTKIISIGIVISSIVAVFFFLNNKENPVKIKTIENISIKSISVKKSKIENEIIEDKNTETTNYDKKDTTESVRVVVKVPVHVKVIKTKKIYIKDSSEIKKDSINPTN